MILVGEVRDADTARIAVQSALTGHLVLSSIHGTDSVAALHRMLDMGIESFLIASSVVGIVGQRLLRRICGACKEVYQPPVEEIDPVPRRGRRPRRPSTGTAPDARSAQAPATAIASACTNCSS